MPIRYLAMLAVLVGGCSDEPMSEGSDGSGSSDATSSNASNATQGETMMPPGSGTAGTNGSTGTTTDATDTETADVDTSDSGSTGDPPPTGSPGCDGPMNLEDGEHQFMLDGNDRRYILRLPENYSNEDPWPLIFALHGNGGNPGYWDGIGGDRDIRTAFATEAVIIIPEAINNAWRDYDADPETWPAGIELELNYFDTVYEAARNELCIDEDNVFSMGFSGGGSFSGVLGCRRDYIRAIAVGGSVIYFEPEQCEFSPAAWITIGDGELTAGREAFRDFFRDQAGCQGSTTDTEPAGCVAYEGCGPGTPVIFCSHPAGHVWPSIGTDATKAFFQSFYGAG